MNKPFFSFVVFILITISFVEPPDYFLCFAESKTKELRQHPELQIPSRLRPRVNFWIDVFGNYTKAQVIIHHRRFPQIRFSLLDIEQETNGMNDVAFDSYKDRALKAKLKEVREDIAYLAKGQSPISIQQRSIEQAMRGLGPGLSKYLRIVGDPELVRGQSGIRQKTATAIQRSGRYLPILEDIFINDFGLPVELTRLPFVESSFDYRAYSSVAAAGIWQFMPKTARSYMRLSSTLDERLDPVESTRAAALYLRSAYARLGTWPLALTSYNHGVAGVLSKVRKFGTADISTLIENSDETPPFGFASANFFPSFLAAKEIYERRSEFFPGIMPEAALRIAMIRLYRSIMITEVMNKLGVSEEELRQVNYGFSERIWRGQTAIPAGYNLKVPERFEARLVKAGFGVASENFDVDMAAIHEPMVAAVQNSAKEKAISGKDLTAASSMQSSTEPTSNSVKESKSDSYRVRPGDTLYSIARDFEVSVTDLKRRNNIKGSSVFVGKSLFIPQTKLVTESAKLKSQNKQGALVKLYTVKKGDTAGSIAKRMGITLSKLTSSNGLSTKKPSIKIGQVLRIPLG